MLNTGNDALTLHTVDGLCRGDARQEWVCAKAFPVATCSGETTHVGHWAESDVDTLAAMFCTHGFTALVDEVLVPGSGDIDTCGAEKQGN